ncbi:beta-Ig-H3/fasciclin [Jannaschia sp. CCS1]|nr:beta-Ig-H3/fasciclin [Jannaschia sp. CCS1]
MTRHQPTERDLIMRRTLIALAATTALASPAFADGHAMNIVETAAEAGSFTTLLAAAEAAGLVETLSGEGPLTVFAPTDEAFAALPEGTVEGLLADTDALTAVLTYHVVAGAVMSGDLTDGMTAATVNGADITVSLDPVMINDANVVTADIEASNGVIHVIDSVLLPPM